MQSVCVISIIRVPTLQEAADAKDPTWDNVAVALWTLAEFNMAILCSSLPILRPLFFKVSGMITGNTNSTGTVPTERAGVEHSTSKLEVNGSALLLEERGGRSTELV